mgnify:CR=1 FL=1
MNNLDWLRGSVRPILTYAFGGILLGLTVFLVVRTPEASLTTKFTEVFLTTTALLIGLYVGTRNRSDERKP